MSRTTVALAFAACLPVGAVLGLASTGNHVAEAITVVAACATTGSVGWYGPRMALELHQDTVMQGRHRRAADTAARIRAAAAEPYGRQDEDDLERTGEQPALAGALPPSERHAEQAEAADGLMPRRPRTVTLHVAEEHLVDAYGDQAIEATKRMPRVDPYRYPEDGWQDFGLEQPAAEPHQTPPVDLSARGTWTVPPFPASL